MLLYASTGSWIFVRPAALPSVLRSWRSSILRDASSLIRKSLQSSVPLYSRLWTARTCDEVQSVSVKNSVGALVRFLGDSGSRQQPARPYPPTLPSRKGVLYCSACTVCILRAANPRVCSSNQSLGSSHTSGCVTKAPVDRSRQDF